MDMTGVYACLFEAVCDVTTVPSHLKAAKLRDSLARKVKTFLLQFLLFVLLPFYLKVKKKYLAVFCEPSILLISDQTHMIYTLC